MTDVLFYSTLVLNFAGFIFAALYIWVNAYARYSDLTDRSENALQIAKVSMGISIPFAFLTCLLADSEMISEAISTASLLYFIIAITWLAVIAVCGITMLVTVISKNLYKPQIPVAIKRLFRIALPGALVSLVLTWLFS